MKDVSGHSRVILVGVWKTIVLRATWTMEAQFKSFPEKTILAIGLENVPVIF